MIEQDFDNTLQYEYVFESVDRDHTINVEFSSNDFTITVTYEGGGEVTPNGVVSVTSGDNKSFAFNPNEGHYVSAIVIDNQNLTGSTLTNTITKGYYNFENITANHSIHIVFTSYTYKIDIKINGNGTVSCDQDLTSVKYGEDRTIKLNVNLDNYGVEVYINGKKVHVNSNDLVIVNIKEDITIEITFDKKAFFETKTGLTIIITISVLLILIIVSIPIIRTIIRRKRYRIIK